METSVTCNVETGPTNGFLELVAYFPDSQACFVGGWFSRTLALSASAGNLEGCFTDQTLSMLHPPIIYVRDDLPENCVGFLVQFQGYVTSSTRVESIIVCKDSTPYYLVSVEKIYNLTPSLFSEHLRTILPRIEGDELRQVAHDILMGRCAIDFVTLSDGLATIEGWLLATTPGVQVSADSTILLCSATTFRRPDAETTIGTHSIPVFGFLIIVPEVSILTSLILTLGPTNTQIVINLPSIQSTRSQIDDVIARHINRRGFLAQHTLASPAWASVLATQLDYPPAHSNEVKGFIEQARCAPNLAGLIVGWTVCLPGWQFYVVTHAGHTRSLSLATRWNRADVIDNFNVDFGSYTYNAGFLIGIEGILMPGEPVHLIAFRKGEAYRLASFTWTAAPLEPVSYARWAFDFPVPTLELANRFILHDRFMIQPLLEQRNAEFRKIPPEVFKFGNSHPDPRCSLIIPLYGRYDFMDHQLIAFADDEILARHSEIIYVVDDPRIIHDVLAHAKTMYHLYDIPFTLLVSHVNRGFAAASNIGARHSCGPTVLLMNSDVIPLRSGWLGLMISSLLQDSSTGIVGARLLDCHYRIQHDGMVMEWDDSWNAHLNKHPGAGFKAGTPAPKAGERSAVTAACMLLRRSTFDEVCGLDEGYLIGDFEDSDLCLKVRMRGLRILCQENVDLVHLERQSFAGVGSDRFRDTLARYNAISHELRWGTFISSTQSKRNDSTS